MFCDQCGKKNRDGARFCYNCGNDLSRQSQEEYVEESEIEYKDDIKKSVSAENEINTEDIREIEITENAIKDFIINNIKDAFSGRVYLSPSIPEKKIIGANEGITKNAEGEILSIFDYTVFASAKEGIAFYIDKMAYHFYPLEFIINYNEINDIIIRRNKNNACLTIVKNDKSELELFNHSLLVIYKLAAFLITVSSAFNSPKIKTKDFEDGAEYLNSVYESKCLFYEKTEREINSEIKQEKEDKENAKQEKKSEKKAKKAAKENAKREKEIARMNDENYIKLTCKRVYQQKYTCKSCGNNWYYGKEDAIKDFYNITHFNVYSANQIKAANKCPKCGSTASTSKQVSFWVDKKGNCLLIKE